MTELEVCLSREHRPAQLPAVEGAPTSHPPRPDPLAWPAALEVAAARSRWAERHRAVTVVREVRSSTARSADGTALLDALADAGARAAAGGARRMDLRVAATHPVVPWLVHDGWIVGHLDDGPHEGGDVVASRSLALPWAHATAMPGWTDRLPSGARRALRRIRGIEPARLPRLAAELAREARGDLRLRRLPPAPEARPRPGAPEGAHPFAATRFSTIDHALERVAPDLRSTVLIDIGAGDGRVLRQALDHGMAGAIGRELDADLAARARALAPTAVVEVGDALARPIPPEVGVVYLNNPFDAALVPRLAQLVAASLAEQARPLAVLYVNPPTIAPLVAIGLVPVDLTPTLTVLVTRSP